MNINVLFDVPALVAQGLMNGSLERVGGVVRDSSSKQVVMWLQEGGSEVSKALANPPLAGGANALAAANPLLAAVNLGVSVAGFAMVLQQLNRISDQIRALEAKVDRISHKLDDQALAQLKAGINACQNAVELQDPTLRIQMAGQALTTLHAARQFFNQQVVRSAGKAEASSAEYVGLAFVALAAEVQTYLQLDEGAKAARTLSQGLDELRPGLTQLMNAVLDCTCHYLKPEFAGEVDLNLMLWLHNGFRRMKCKPGESSDQLTASELFDIMRPHITKVFKSHEDWHGEIPQVVVDTSGVRDWWIGPLNQGTDTGARFRLVKEELTKGLNKIVALVEAHDRLMAQVLQLEEMERLGLKPTDLKQQLLLPEGQAAAVVLDARWIAQEVIA
jgi:outer membrane murein-binding lipoprotein Lpp